jgi:hypothetical protein
MHSKLSLKKVTLRDLDGAGQRREGAGAPTDGTCNYTCGNTCASPCNVTQNTCGNDQTCGACGTWQNCGTQYQCGYTWDDCYTAKDSCWGTCGYVSTDPCWSIQACG